VGRISTENELTFLCVRHGRNLEKPGWTVYVAYMKSAERTNHRLIWEGAS
jgi:hypothetical protein